MCVIGTDIAGGAAVERYGGSGRCQRRYCRGSEFSMGGCGAGQAAGRALGGRSALGVSGAVCLSSVRAGAVVGRVAVTELERRAASRARH